MTTKIITTAPSTTHQEAAASMYNGIKNAFAAHGGWTISEDLYDSNLNFTLRFINNNALIDGEPIALNFYSTYVTRYGYYGYVSGYDTPALCVGYSFSDGELNKEYYTNGNQTFENIDHNMPSWSLDYNYVGWLGLASWKILVSDRYAILIANSNDDNRQAGIYAVGDLINYFNAQGLTGRQKLIAFAAGTGSNLDQNQCTKIVRYGYDENGNKGLVTTRIINNNDNIQKNVNVERGSQELLTPAMLNMKDNIGYLGELLPGVIFKIQQPTSYIGIHGSEGIVSGHTYKRALDTNSGYVGRLAVRWEESV